MRCYVKTGDYGGAPATVLARALLPAAAAAAPPREERVDEDRHDRVDEARREVVAAGLRRRHARAGVHVGLREEGRRVRRVGQRREPGDGRARGALVRGDDAHEGLEHRQREERRFWGVSCGIAEGARNLRAGGIEASSANVRTVMITGACVEIECDCQAPHPSSASTATSAALISDCRRLSMPGRAIALDADRVQWTQDHAENVGRQAPKRGKRRSRAATEEGREDRLRQALIGAVDLHRAVRLRLRSRRHVNDAAPPPI